MTLGTGNLTIEGGGTLAGTDSFAVNGVLTLNAYSTLGLSGTVDPYGGISIASTNDTTINGTTLNNHGAATWQFSPNDDEYLVLNAGAVINNLSALPSRSVAPVPVTATTPSRTWTARRWRFTTRGR